MPATVAGVGCRLIWELATGLTLVRVITLAGVVHHTFTIEWRTLAAPLQAEDHVKETLEHELKLSVGSGFVLPPLAVDVEPRNLRATYHDTADHRLARHGVTLRRRSEGSRDFWQLKLPRGGDRLEIAWDADESAVPEEVKRLLTAYLRGSALRPVAELHTLRRAVRVTGKGDGAAEVVHDSVQVLQGNRIVREFDEVEIEQLRDGSGRLIARLERQLRAAGAKRSDGRPEGVPGSRPARAGAHPGQARRASGRACPRLSADAGRRSRAERSADAPGRGRGRARDARRDAPHAQRAQGGAQAARAELGRGDPQRAEVARQPAR